PKKNKKPPQKQKKTKTKVTLDRFRLSRQLHRSRVTSARSCYLTSVCLPRFLLFGLPFPLPCLPALAAFAFCFLLLLLRELLVVWNGSQGLATILSIKGISDSVLWIQPVDDSSYISFPVIP
ncbi:MAG: hypothetical protein ACI4XW_06515, partial [Candidatus Spyradocola sp.]